MQIWFAHALTGEGWQRGVRLRIADGIIQSVAADSAPQAGDDAHGIGLPGLPNLHSHAFQRAMAGLCETRGPGADSFWTWRQTMYRFLHRLTPDDVEAVAAMAYAEMLEAGFTRVGEFHYLHHAPDGTPYAQPAEMAERIAAAAAQTGIALTLLPVFYAHGGFGGAPPAEGQRRFVSGLDGFARLMDGARSSLAGLPDAVLGLAPHSLRAAAPDQLAVLPGLAAGGPIHIHVAEQTAEVEACLAWSGRRPVDWLLDHAPVDRSWCLVHATHMTAAETVRMARSGAVAGLCPLTEANLGDGLFPAPAFTEAGGAYGVGSDSNVRIDARGELEMLEYGQRLATRSRNVLAGNAGQSTGRSLFDAAGRGGAQALGAAAPVLAPGAPADLVGLRADPWPARGGDPVLDHWIFGPRAGGIDRVWRGGRLVVRDGSHVDRSRIAARFQSVLAGLLD